MPYRSWKYTGKDNLIAEQQYAHVPRVLILDGLSRRVYEDLHMDEFKHQLEDNLWIEEKQDEPSDHGLTVVESKNEIDLVSTHTASLLLLIDQFTEDLHPLRHSNSYKFLKKKFDL